MKTEPVPAGPPADVATYHLDFEPRRPRVAGYNLQPKRKDGKDLVQISINTKVVTTTICFFPTDRITNQGVGGRGVEINS